MDAKSVAAEATDGLPTTAAAGGDTEASCGGCMLGGRANRPVEERTGGRGNAPCGSGGAFVGVVAFVVVVVVSGLEVGATCGALLSSVVSSVDGDEKRLAADSADSDRDGSKATGVGNEAGAKALTAMAAVVVVVVVASSLGTPSLEGDEKRLAAAAWPASPGPAALPLPNMAGGGGPTVDSCGDDHEALGAAYVGDD